MVIQLLKILTLILIKKPINFKYACQRNCQSQSCHIEANSGANVKNEARLRQLIRGRSEKETAKMSGAASRHGNCLGDYVTGYSDKIFTALEKDSSAQFNTAVNVSKNA